MPGDPDISDEEGCVFTAIIEHFQKSPDPRCIPLLINAVSKNNALGMYEDINLVLMAQSKEAVVPILREGLRNGNEGVKYRCCWWAADIGAWKLEDAISPLVNHDDCDIREAATSFLELKSEIA